MKVLNLKCDFCGKAIDYADQKSDNFRMMGGVFPNISNLHNSCIREFMFINFDLATDVVESGRPPEYTGGIGE